MKPRNKSVAMAERAVLGACMVAPEAYASVGDLLRAEHFLTHEHGLVYAQIVDRATKGLTCDAVTLTDVCETQGILGLLKGPAFLIELANDSFSASNARAYAQIVVDAWLERQIRALGQQIASMEGDGPMIADAASSMLAKLIGGHQQGGPRDAKEYVREWYKQLTERYESRNAITGLPTPWAGLNKITHGLQPGNLIILAARPQVGKTAVALNIATSVALRGLRVLIFEQEMTGAELIQRAVSSIGNIPHDFLLSPVDDAEGSDSYWPRVTVAGTELVGSGLAIDESPSLTVEQICARAKRAHLARPLSLVIVDHLQIVKLPKTDNVARALGDVTGALKALAKQLNVPVLLLSQLNRGPENRTNKRPGLGDLRESGAIEQDADLVLFLYREDLYDPNTHLAGLIELIVGKGRNIPANSRVNLRNKLDRMLVDEWEGALPEAPVQQIPARPRGFARPKGRMNGYHADP